ncbi:RIMS-binding protein 3A-like [Rhynchocyon petersi]
MSKDYPSPLRGRRASPKKPSSPRPAAAVLEEPRRELEKLRAELEAERARGRAERRRFEAQARQLRESGERERRQLVDHLRSKWEARSCRELRQLQEAVLREREAEIRQLLRWKEAELRQLQQVLHRERDGVVRQARELQRQLAEELVNRGYGGRTGAPDAAATQCRCRLQDVLAQLRWDTDGQQAARIRHLQAALKVERQLFLKYILEHRWRPALSAPRDPQNVHVFQELPPEAASRRPDPARRRQSLRGLSTVTHPRSQSLDSVPTVRSRSLDSSAPSRSRSLDRTRGRPKTPEREELASSWPDALILGSSSPAHPPPASQPPPAPPQSPAAPLSADGRSGEPQRGEGSGSPPCEDGAPSPPGPDYAALVKRNSELAEALQVLACRCSSLSEENSRLRRAGFPDDADEKVKRLKVKNAELAGLARRLEDRARKLQETNLRALSAPLPGDSREDLDLCQPFLRQRSRDPAEQASAHLAKDRRIAELQRECHLLRARFASGLSSASLPERDVAGTQWLSISDLERLLRESQWEVLRLQRQLMEPRGQGGSQAQAQAGAPSEEAQRRPQELERELGARQRECEELRAQAAEAWRRSEEAEAQLHAALREGARLAEENARLQTQAADQMRKVAADKSDVLGQPGREGPEQRPQHAARGQDRQRQLQLDLQKGLKDRQTARETMATPHCQPQEGTPLPRPQTGEDGTPEFQPESEDEALVQRSRNEPEREAWLPQDPGTLEKPASAPQTAAGVSAVCPQDSKSLAQKASSDSSSEMESLWVTVPSCPNGGLDTESEVDDLELDSVSSTLDLGSSETPATTKCKIFLARYSYNALEGPSEHPERELPLTAGDYVYIYGDMDEDGFYEGEPEDSRQGLLTSNLVEQVPDCDILGCPLPESPYLHPIPLQTGQRPLISGKAQAVVVRALLGSKRAPCMAPMQLGLQHVTPTSVEITWVCSSSCHPHVVYLNGQEHAQTPAGVNYYTFHSLRPATRYQVQVAVRLPRALLQVPQQTVSSTITFATPLVGPPDPPLDVLVECHSSPGHLLVSWLPVTIDSAGSSNGVQVTGYAVYADGLKVAEVASATAGSTLLDCSQLQIHATCQKISVRTMSLCGESPDSVPAQVPENLLTCHRLPETSSCGYICGDTCTSRATSPFWPQKAAVAPLSAKASPRAPRSGGGAWAEFLETFPEELPRPWPPVPSPSSEAECQTVQQQPSRAASQALNCQKVWEVIRKDLPFQRTLQDPRIPVVHGSPTGEERYYQGPGLRRSLDTRLSHPPPEHGPRGALCPHRLSWMEDMWMEEGQQHRDSLRAQESRGQRRELDPVLCPTLSSQVIKMSKVDPPLRGQGANSLGRVFVALFDYDPQVMSANPQAAEGELTFQKGQLLRVWGSQDSNGFYHGECSGQVGNIPGHLVAEVGVGLEWIYGRWHPPTQEEYLCPVACLEDFGGVTSHQGSFPMVQGGSRTSPLWTPKTMVAAFDYNPREKQAGVRAKDKLVLKAGDMVTVYGPVDDQGFYYGESGGQWGLVPAHLLDHMSFHAE